MAKKQKINFQTPVGVAKYPHLNRPDTAFDSAGRYKTEIILPSEAAKPLIKIIEDAAKEAHGKKEYNVPYVIDKDTGEVAFKLTSKYEPKFFDTAGQLVPTNALPQLGGGSRIAGKGFLNVYKELTKRYGPDGELPSCGVAITLQAVQIVEASQGMSGEGFDAIDGGGFTVDTSVADDPFESTGGEDNFDF